MKIFLLFPLLLTFHSGNNQLPSFHEGATTPWTNFLSHLPVREGPIKDYQGNLVSNQGKHYLLVNYDAGTGDLQQCADFLMRLRAEYLFANQRSSEISFRFNNGQAYSFRQYCEGLTPALVKGKLIFRRGGQNANHYGSLRKYLNHVFMYAGTIALDRDLPAANDLAIGTIIVGPGSPGHCMIIIDEKMADGKKLYKLAESYMPAQTPYILKNPQDGTPWYALKKGSPIRTSSFYFTKYNLRKFE